MGIGNAIHQLVEQNGYITRGNARGYEIGHILLEVGHKLGGIAPVELDAAAIVIDGLPDMTQRKLHMPGIEIVECRGLPGQNLLVIAARLILLPHQERAPGNGLPGLPAVGVEIVDLEVYFRASS